MDGIPALHHPDLGFTTNPVWGVTTVILHYSFSWHRRTAVIRWKLGDQSPSSTLWWIEWMEMPCPWFVSGGSMAWSKKLGAKPWKTNQAGAGALVRVSLRKLYIYQVSLPFWLTKFWVRKKKGKREIPSDQGMTVLYDWLKVFLFERLPLRSILALCLLKHSRTPSQAIDPGSLYIFLHSRSSSAANSSSSLCREESNRNDLVIAKTCLLA